MGNTQLDHSHHRRVNKNFPICFLLHDISVPMNIGSLFRLADALGVERVYLSGCSSVPPHSKIRKTSRSAEKYVPFSYVDNPLAVIDTLKRQAYTIISLELTSSSIDLKEMRLPENAKICLIPGAERSGVAQELLEASDITIHIPMLGENSSMNVASACSIATYEIIRRFQMNLNSKD